MTDKTALNYQEVYPCPVCRRGEIATLPLMETFACNFCQHIFTANLEQQVLKMADNQSALSWYWNGRHWKGALAEGTDLVSRVTYDLTIPLMAIDRMLGLFQEGLYGEIPPEMNKAIHSLSRVNQNLLETIDNLFEVYCHESGKKTLTFSDVNLWEIIEEVRQELAPLAEETGIELSLNALATGPIQAIGDRLELRRVFTNLIGNAIKFTYVGHVRVNCQPATESDPLISISIEDTGSGIHEEELPQLFESFLHGGDRLSTSGLGLYLSRHIINAHRGSISVTSELNKGSVFLVRLPARVS